MRQGILSTDGTSRHFTKHVFPMATQHWTSKETFAPITVFGPLKKGVVSEETVEGYRGARFSAFFSENLSLIEKRVRGGDGQIIGGFCFLHHGDVVAHGVTNGRIVKWALENPPPKPIFDGGADIPKSVIDELGITEFPTQWKLEISGLTKVSWDVLVKATRYFEIARATGQELTLVVPSYEYAVSSAANASLLKMDGEEVKHAVLQLGEKYASFLGKVGSAFFGDVKLKIILTHDPEFRGKLADFMQRYPLIGKTEMKSGDGFISGVTEEQVRAIRDLWREESVSYLAIFSYIFGSDKSTIFMIHGRDFGGYPVEGLEAANGQFGGVRIRKNVALVGVPSAPIITIKGNAFPLIMRGLYGSESVKFTKREKPVPPDADARYDAYFGLPGELLSSSHLDMGTLGLHLTRGGGDCPFFIYARSLYLYQTVVSESEVKKALKSCNSNASHDGCKAVFVQMHKEISQKLGD